MERIKWSETVTNEQVLERIGEKRILLNNILRRKVNWICRILRRDAIERRMTEVKGMEEHRSLMIWEQKKILGAKGGS